MMEKPDVDRISGLSPAISIEQKTTSKNPRSTVGTATEIYDYLRLPSAPAGTPPSPRPRSALRLPPPPRRRCGDPLRAGHGPAHRGAAGPGHGGPGHGHARR